MSTSKPQYRTLVKALDELQVAAIDVLEPFTGKTLGPRMKTLRRATDHANEVVQRARDAMEEKERKRDADKRP